MEKNKIINPITGVLIYIISVVFMYVLTSDMPSIHKPIILSTVVAMLSNLLITAYTLASTNCKPFSYVMKVVASLLGPAIVITAIIMMLYQH